MRIIAFVTERPAIHSILRYLGEPTALPESVPAHRRGVLFPPRGSIQPPGIELGGACDTVQFPILVISRGRSGYVAMYRYDAARDIVFVLRIRHQREAGFVD
jgi:plasmid stabilization system protein ParE